MLWMQNYYAISSLSNSIQYYFITIQVYYFIKDPVPDAESLPNFVQKLAKVAVNIEEYTAAYNTSDSER